MCIKAHISQFIVCYVDVHNIIPFINCSACQVCTPNATNTVWSHCQCVLADGVERGILTANRMIPGPSIQVCEGDKVVVDVENHMEGMEVTLHWHGIWQRGTQYYDGVPFVTQCPIQQGNTFRLLKYCFAILLTLDKKRKHRKPLTELAVFIKEYITCGFDRLLHISCDEGL